MQSKHENQGASREKTELTEQTERGAIEKDQTQGTLHS